MTLPDDWEVDDELARDLCSRILRAAQRTAEEVRQRCEGEEDEPLGPEELDDEPAPDDRTRHSVIRGLADELERLAREPIAEDYDGPFGLLQEAHMRASAFIRREVTNGDFMAAESVAFPFFHGHDWEWRVLLPTRGGAGMPAKAPPWREATTALLRNVAREWSPELLVRTTVERMNAVASNGAHAIIANRIANAIPHSDDADRERLGHEPNRDALAFRVRENVRAFLERHRLRMAAPIDASGAEPPEGWARTCERAAKRDAIDGAFFFDCLFAEHIEGTGKAGKALATEVRAKSAGRMAAFARGERSEGELCRLWFDPDYGSTGLPWLELLAEVLWRDAVRPQIDRETRQRPALAIQVHEDVTRIHSRTFVEEERDGQRALVFDRGEPIALATIADTTVLELVQRGVKLLGSVTAHKALRWEVLTGHMQIMRGDADPRVLTIAGGWSGFAGDVLKLRKKGAADDLKAIVHAQQAVRVTLPNGRNVNGLLSLDETPARGRRRGLVKLTLGTMLLPHFVHEIGEGGRDAHNARRLVPVLDLPPMVGRERDHGAQATLSMLVVRELRVRARELVAEGGAAISLERFAELAHAAGLPPSTLGRVLARWAVDGDDGPAFIVEKERGRYTLGDAHRLERAFLETAGKIEIAASEAGKRSVEAREAKKRRLRRSVSD
jgi:hypothetical protein